MSSIRDFHVFPNSLVMGPGIARVGGSHLVGANEASAMLTVSPTACDPYWSDITLLIQPPDDAVSGSTSIVDRSDNGSAVTLYNGAQINTTKDYPTVLFDGSNDYGLISYSGGADIDGACTLDFIIARLDSRELATVFSTRSLSSPINGWMFQVQYGYPALYFWDDGDKLELHSSIVMTYDTAHHIRVTVDANKNVKMAVDGVVAATGTATGWPATSGYTPQIGISKIHNARYFYGHVRTVCITQGVMRDINEALDIRGIAGC